MRIDTCMAEAAQMGITQHDLRFALMHITKQPWAWIRLHEDSELGATELENWQQIAVQLAAGVPLAYTLGFTEFWGLRLHVTPDVLIPRPDSEHLVATALELSVPQAKINQALRVLDMGTGSGALIIALAHERPHWQCYALDLHPQALAVAQRNALDHRCLITFYQSHWFEQLAHVSQEPFDMIVTNPPYLAHDDHHLQTLQHEPASALVADEQGLGDIRRIIFQAGAWLATDGWLLVEHGYTQAAQVRLLFEQQGFVKVHSIRDYGGHERVTVGMHEDMQMEPAC